MRNVENYVTILVSGGIKDNPANLAARLTLPTNIDASKMTGKQQDIYVLQMQIHDATRNLAKPDLGIPPNPRDRSPSPEPIYNSNGKRLNTRLERTRNKLINQRNNAITKIKELDPTYQPPSHYNYKNTKLEDKVLIPADVSWRFISFDLVDLVFVDFVDLLIFFRFC